MTLSITPPPPQPERLERQIRLMRNAVEDATYELWEGKLSYRESEALASEIRAVRVQIAALERDLRG